MVAQSHDLGENAVVVRAHERSREKETKGLKQSCSLEPTSQ